MVPASQMELVVVLALSPTHLNPLLALVVLVDVVVASQELVVVQVEQRLGLGDVVRVAFSVGRGGSASHQVEFDPLVEVVDHRPSSPVHPMIC